MLAHVVEREGAERHDLLAPRGDVLKDGAHQRRAVAASFEMHRHLGVDQNQRVAAHAESGESLGALADVERVGSGGIVSRQHGRLPVGEGSAGRARGKSAQRGATVPAPVHPGEQARKGGDGDGALLGE